MFDRAVRRQHGRAQREPPVRCRRDLGSRRARERERDHARRRRDGAPARRRARAPATASTASLVRGRLGRRDPLPRRSRPSSTSALPERRGRSTRSARRRPAPTARSTSPTKGPRFRMNEWTTVITDDGAVAPGRRDRAARAARPRAASATTRTRRRPRRRSSRADGVRWAIPGDRAVIEDDGTITVLGRGSQCINTGGEKVFPEEVEAVLKSHPDVFDAIVVGVPDERWGERVAAVVPPRPAASRSTTSRSTAAPRSPATRCPASSSSSTTSSAPPPASPTTAGRRSRDQQYVTTR